MEDEIVTSKGPAHFLKYITEFDSIHKNELMNIVQYAVLAIIPVVVILKVVKHYVPDHDESKGSVEIYLEIIGQIVFITSMVWFSDRIIRYIPTYSGGEYQTLNSINYILQFLIIMSTLQTKFGYKINTIVDRIVKHWNGTETIQIQQVTQTVYKEPSHTTKQEPSQKQPENQPDDLDTNELLPSNRNLTTMPQEPSSQKKPDFSKMYQNSIHDAKQEPMAANDGDDLFGGW